MNLYYFRFILLVFAFAPAYILAGPAPRCSGGPSSNFILTGAIAHPKFFTPAILEKYQTSKMTVSY